MRLCSESSCKISEKHANFSLATINSPAGILNVTGGSTATGLSTSALGFYITTDSQKQNRLKHHIIKPSFDYKLVRTISSAATTSVEFSFSEREWRLYDMVYDPLLDGHHEITPGSSAQNRSHEGYYWREPMAVGKWNEVTESEPHLVLDELNLQIPYFHNFTQGCAWEPFLQVHRTNNLTQEEIVSQRHKWWSVESDSSVVARTASFGFGQSRLDMCWRRQNYEMRTNHSMQYPGLDDSDFMVPLGLIAAMRLRFAHSGTRDFCYRGTSR